MANSKSPKRKTAILKNSTNKRRLTYGGIVFGLVVIILGILHFKFVNYQITTRTDKSRDIGTKVLDVEDNMPSLVISGGYDTYNTFRIETVRIIPVGWQKYKIYINADKQNLMTDAIRLPANIHLHMKITHTLPKGRYEVVTNITGTNTIRMLTADFGPPEKKEKMKAHTDTQHFIIR